MSFVIIYIYILFCKFELKFFSVPDYLTLVMIPQLSIIQGIKNIDDAHRINRIKVPLSSRLDMENFHRLLGLNP